MASRAVELSQNPSRSRQLDFSKAMNDFKVMFPTFDYEVIEMILRANNGLVDATVDQLLAMQTEDSQTTKNKHLDPELNVRLPSYIDEGAKTSEPPPAYTPRVEEDPNFRYDSTYLKQHFSPCYHTPTTATLNAKKPSFSNGESSRYRSPMIGTLPNDFLRLNFDSHENTKPVKRVTCNREAIFTNNPFYDVRKLEMPKNSSREYTSRQSQETTATQSRSVSRSSVKGNDPEFHDIPTNNEDDRSGMKKGKKFGQMSRKFKRKKTKNAKGATYQEIPGSNLIDDDSANDSWPKETQRRI